MILDGETVLADDYPVYWGYAYAADGKVVSSDVQGTVADLKRDIGATEIRRCEIVKRLRMSGDGKLSIPRG